jgi:ribosomal protein L34E
VKAFGDVVDALRIRPFAPKVKSSEPEKCSKCGNEVVAAGKMTAEQVAEYSRRKKGVVLCAECMKAEYELQQKVEQNQSGVMENAE